MRRRSSQGLTSPLLRRFVLLPVLLCALLWLGVGPAGAERVALVIGNGAYRNANALVNPPQDAAAIGAKLEELDFRVTRAIDADLDGMRAALATFGETARGADAAVIFYAGHGLQVEGENYLIPVDARIGARDDLTTDALRASEIYSALLAAEPELAVLILDACRDNPFVSVVSTSAGLASGSVSASALVQRPNSAGMVIGFAAAPGAVAFDGGDGNSPYTTALLQWIDRPGLEIGAMFRRVRGTVVELTRGEQVPWVEEALLREVFLRPADSAAVAQAAETASVEVALLETIRALDVPAEQTAAMEFYGRLTGDPKGEAEEDAPVNDAFVRAGLIWLSIRRTTDIGLLEQYVEAFPDSQFAGLALDRIALLGASRAAAADETDAGPIAASAPADDTLPPVTEPPALDLRETGRPATVATPSLSPAEAEAALGLDRRALAAVQALLAQAGDYAGATDAIFGPGTRRAVEAFQQSAGMVATGYLNRETLRALVHLSAGPLLRTEPDAAQRDAVHEVAAVAEAGAAAVPTVLRVATLSRNDDVHVFWQELVARFEADHPGTRVLIEHQPDWQYKANLLAMLGSATPPDILHTWGGGHLDALRDAGFVRDLSAEMAEGWALEFRPGALQNYTRDGRIYGVPSAVALVSLWVNAPLLERAGIPLAQLATWDGFLAAVRALKAQGIVPLAVGGRDNWPFQMIWGNLALQRGGRAAFEAAYAGEGDGFLAPAFVEASEQLRALAALEPFQEGFLEMDEATAGNAFAQGQTAMVVTGDWRLHSMGWNWPGLQDRMRRELRRLDFPAFPVAAEGLLTYGGVDGYAVNRRAPDVALDLLRLLTSQEVLSRISELATTVPSVSGSDLGLDDPLMAGVAEALLSSSYHQLYYDQALGPIAGEVLNEVTMRLATGALTGLEAAQLIDRAWDEARLDLTPAARPPALPGAAPSP